MISFEVNISRDAATEGM